MWAKVKDIVYLVIILVLVIVSLGKCDRFIASGPVEIQKDTAMAAMVKGIETKINKSIEVNNQEQIKLLLAHNDTLSKMLSYFKKVNNTLIIKTQTTLKDSIRLKDSIPCNFEPREFNKVTPNYSAFGRITNKALFIDGLIIPNEQSLVLGDKKTNIWGHTERRAMVVNSNSLVATNSIQNITIKEKKKWWERPIIVAPGGFLLGTAIVKTIQSFSK